MDHEPDVVIYEPSGVWAMRKDELPPGVEYIETPIEGVVLVVAAILGTTEVYGVQAEPTTQVA